MKEEAKFETEKKEKEATKVPVEIEEVKKPKEEVPHKDPKFVTSD